MNPTNYPHVNEFLGLLLAGMRQVLGGKLVGLYLHGSLVMGDYDDTVSDIDLLAALTSELTSDEFHALRQVQGALVAEHSRWHDRIEIAHLSLDALKTFRERRSPIAIISPGEPFHITDAGADWLMNWYMVREIGVTLFGPPPETVIDFITKAEFVQAVRNYILAWRGYIQERQTRPSQAYAILTMCRGLYTYRSGEQVSKVRAARWAMGELPAWAGLIRQAVEWRESWRETDVDHAATLPETRRFVDYVIGLMGG